MCSHDNKGPNILGGNVASPDDIRIISFKEEYFSNLVEAEALLEVVGKMVAHHEDIQMTSKAFMGVSILIEKISRLIDIDANLVSDSDTAANTLVAQEAVN